MKAFLTERGRGEREKEGGRKGRKEEGRKKEKATIEEEEKLRDYDILETNFQEEQWLNVLNVIRGFSSE